MTARIHWDHDTTGKLQAYRGAKLIHLTASQYVAMRKLTTYRGAPAPTDLSAAEYAEWVK